MNTLPEYALSIRQPWAWLIVKRYKKPENRIWATQFRGPCAIHASQGMTHKEYDQCAEFVRTLGITLPAFDDLPRGGIVGQGTISDCIKKSNDPFLFGPYAFVFEDAIELPFRPCKGKLGFFLPVFTQAPPPPATPTATQPTFL